MKPNTYEVMTAQAAAGGLATLIVGLLVPTDLWILPAVIAGCALIVTWVNRNDSA